MDLERPDLAPRHRGVRPAFLWALMLIVVALGATLVWSERNDAAPFVAAPAPPDWFAANKAHCNPVEVTTLLARSAQGPGANGLAQRAACLAIAGKLAEAHATLLALHGAERSAAVDYVFQVAHPVADAGDDESAMPIMELVIEFQPNQYMALYHAGMAAARPDGDDEKARAYLTRFLALYHANNGWTRSARAALAAVDRPAAQRTVERRAEGSVVY